MEENQEKIVEMETTKEKQIEQSVQDTKMSSMSPPHDTRTPIETITVKNVPNSSPQNINPLTVEDLKKILEKPTLQVRLCQNPILVNVNELQKVVVDITRENVNTKEPPSIIPLAISAQTLV